MAVTIGALVVAAPPEAWEAAGFTVAPDATCTIGTVVISLVGRDRGEGIVGWSLCDLPSDVLGGVLDGLPTTESDRPPALPSEHPNAGLEPGSQAVLVAAGAGVTAGAALYRMPGA